MFVHAVKLRNYLMLSIVLLLSLSFVVPTSFAQNQQYRCGVNITQTIAYGDSVTAAIDYNQPAFYCFDAQRGDVVTATVQPNPNNGNLAPTVIITSGVNETMQAISDNAIAVQGGSGELQPVSVNATIDADGTYMIVIVGAQGTRGAFALSLDVEQSQSLLGNSSPNNSSSDSTGQTAPTDSTNSSANNSTLCELDQMAHINYGESATASITSQAPQALFCFEGKTGDIVQITVSASSGGIAPFVVLADSGGNTVYDQATASTPQDTAQIIFQLPQDGSYLIVVGPNNGVAGDVSVELSTSDQAPVNYTCQNEPLSILSQYQWGIVLNQDKNLSVTYNVTCVGAIVMNVLGGNMVLQYQIDHNANLSFTFGDNQYTTASLDQDHWVLQGQDGTTISLDRLGTENCGDGFVAELIHGTWVRDNNAAWVDFMCNGVVFIFTQSSSGNGNYTTGTYTVDGSQVQIDVPSTGQQIFSGEITIDNGTMTWHSADSSNTLTFTNVLSEQK